MTVPLVQNDAFADRPFAGNPAAVCLLEGPADEAWMQAVAAEMNLSETAFLHRDGTGYALWWFTPVAEVALCGHATSQASAHALWERGRAAAGRPIDSGPWSGVLTACATATPSSWTSGHAGRAGRRARRACAEALGLVPRWTGRSRFDWLVEAACRRRSPARGRTSPPSPRSGARRHSHLLPAAATAPT